MTKTQDVIDEVQQAVTALWAALANPHLGPDAYQQLRDIAATLKAIEAMLQSTAMDPNTLLNVLCAAIKDYEGWAAPGEKLNGTLYAHGTTAYQCKNPGNLRCDPKNKAGWNHLATASRSGFCVFPNEQIGLQAQKNVILAVAAGRESASSPYHIYAREHGKENASELTLKEYFFVRDPASDNNDPEKYAKYVGERMGVDYSTWQLKELVA